MKYQGICERFDGNCGAWCNLYHDTQDEAMKKLNEHVSSCTHRNGVICHLSIRMVQDDGEDLNESN